MNTILSPCRTRWPIPGQVPVLAACAALLLAACGGEVPQRADAGPQSPEELLSMLEGEPPTAELCLLVDLVCGKPENKGTSACKQLAAACAAPAPQVDVAAAADAGVTTDAPAPPPPSGNTPDLVVTGISYKPGAPQSGDAVTFSATVKNAGSGSTPAGTIIGVRFTVDGTIASWSDHETSALAPGKSVTVTASGGPAGSGTWTAAQGSHTVEAWVDPPDRIPNESDEGNNKLVVSLMVGGQGTPPPPTTKCLAPPKLSNPIVFNGKCPGDKGGPGKITAGGKDVLIKLPTDRVCNKSSNMTISGARHVHIVGGHLVHTMAHGLDGVNKMIKLANTSGTTFIEGVHIDVNNRYADAIATNGHKGRVIVQNALLRGMAGAPKNAHGDAIHPQSGGPVKEIIFQNVSVYTGYQGLFVPYKTTSAGKPTGHGTRKLALQRVTLAFDPRMSPSQKPLILLYLGHDKPKLSMYGLLDHVPPDGTTLDEVFIDSSHKKVAYHTRVIPAGNPGAGGCATFGTSKIKGKVCDGKPAGGDFAPAKLVGLAYKRAAFCN